MQAACEQDPEMLYLKNVLGLCCSVLGLYICLVYRNTITVLKSINMINEKIFDGQLITLGDYSVQGKINSTMYYNFLAKLGEIGLDNKENTVRAFQKYFTEQIERWLMKNDKDQNTTFNTYAVADLQLAFDNDGMLKMLEKRANALK